MKDYISIKRGQAVYPELGQTVMGYDERKNVYGKAYRNRFGYVIWETSPKNKRRNEVTHWRPL